MALQRLRNDPEAGWELRKRTPLWSPDFLMVSPDCMALSFWQNLRSILIEADGYIGIPTLVHGTGAVELIMQEIRDRPSSPRPRLAASMKP